MVNTLYYKVLYTKKWWLSRDQSDGIEEFLLFGVLYGQGSEMLQEALCSAEG